MTEFYSYENNHSFHSQIATDYGVNTAILVHHIQFWLSRNQKAGVNQHDGKTWMYQTLESMNSAFPYWSRKQLERVVEKATLQGVIAKGNYNQHKYDRTCWYSFVNEEKFGISRSREIENPKSGALKPDIGTPIQDTKTNTEQIKKPLQSPLKKDLVPPKPVVVSPLLESIPGLRAGRAAELTALFTEEQLENAVEMMKNSKAHVPNPFGWLRDCIEQGWEAPASGEGNVAENRKWANDVLKGRSLGGVVIEVLNASVEFVYVGRKPPDVFEYSLAGFKEVVAEHYRRLKKAHESS